MKLCILLLLVAVLHIVYPFPMDPDDYLEDPAGIDERRESKFLIEEDRVRLTKLAKKGLKTLKRMSNRALSKMKAAKKYLKENSFKLTPVECSGKYCKSCISLVLLQQELCIKVKCSKKGGALYLTTYFTWNDESQGRIKTKVGNVPTCMSMGSSFGEACVKAIEGKAKSSKGTPHVNFCLAVLAKEYSIGCKFCATYEDKKMKMKVVPELYPSGQTDNGEIVQLSDQEDGGIELAADEFEID